MFDGSINSMKNHNVHSINLKSMMPTLAENCINTKANINMVGMAYAATMPPVTDFFSFKIWRAYNILGKKARTIIIISTGTNLIILVFYKLLLNNNVYMFFLLFFLMKKYYIFINLATFSLLFII